MGDRDSGAGFVIGFVMGAAIGAAIGFMYAPRPGAETRAMRKERAEEARKVPLKLKRMLRLIARSIIWERRLVIRLAIAAGMVSMVRTRMIPTTCTKRTTVKAIRTRRRR